VNTAASLLFAWSFLRRWRHGKGRLAALLGVNVMGVGGFLGGHLAFRKGLRVDTHTLPVARLDVPPR
jgi:hypothetical protein